ncbi:MAG: SDR family oxidoreductase [Alphaproteobacteria bacterium]|nr:SDR family oxidoreductase [Alphaproteobacteria bacterium]MCB9929254.1 SDR family oxidoreductase [Alphaproteobacteria bacterium]
MRALVTGASPGIGGATCLKLARDSLARGQKPRIAACEVRETDDVKALVDELRGLGAEAIVLTGDLSDPAVPARLVEDAVSAFGGLDAVVGNAGITAPSPLAELALADWDRVMNINLRGNWLLAKAAHPHLKASGGGFVAVASMSGMRPHRGMGAYSMSKSGTIILCEVLAQEWAPDGIRVNCVSPGMIRTPLSESVYRDNSVAAARAALVPTGRVGVPQDIANAIAFFLGPDSGYVTGQNLCVDGAFAASILSHIPGLPRSGA